MEFHNTFPNWHWIVFPIHILDVHLGYDVCLLFPIPAFGFPYSENSTPIASVEASYFRWLLPELEEKASIHQPRMHDFFFWNLSSSRRFFLSLDFVLFVSLLESCYRPLYTRHSFISLLTIQEYFCFLSVQNSIISSSLLALLLVCPSCWVNTKWDFHAWDAKLELEEYHWPINMFHGDSVQTSQQKKEVQKPCSRKQSLGLPRIHLYYSA